jgi:hypothetical protein
VNRGRAASSGRRAVTVDGIGYLRSCPALDETPVDKIDIKLPERSLGFTRRAASANLQNDVRSVERTAIAEPAGLADMTPKTEWAVADPGFSGMVFPNPILVILTLEQA